MCRATSGNRVSGPVLERLHGMKNWRAPALIQIPGRDDDRGSLLSVEWGEQLPFEPKRFYFVRNARPDVRRGGHAHWKEQEVILALAGGFTITADTGSERFEYRLEPSRALYIPTLIWHELYDFSDGAVCAVFASEPHYDEADYCRDYQEFLRLTDGCG